MNARTNVSPVQLQIDIDEGDVTIEYLDDRLVSYRAIIHERDEPVEAPYSYDIHVLVTDTEERVGYMTYVNDLDTTDAILESTGVGRVLLEDGEMATIHQGVIATRTGETITVDATAYPGDGSVYIFVEHQLDERAYQLS